MENVLGIMGGMGPMATQLFYKMLIENTEASCDQEHINVMILGHAGMPDRTKAILSGNEESVCTKLIEDARFLDKNGCKAIAITCNTSHYFVEKIQSEINVPVINMVRESAKEAVLSGSRKTAVLATDGTVRMGLYQKALENEGSEWYIPSEKVQELVMYEIYDRVKNGKPADMTAWKTIEDEIKDAGCERALLACTELSVICEDEGLPPFYLDAMKVLALRSIEFMGRNIRK